MNITTEIAALKTSYAYSPEAVSAISDAVRTMTNYLEYSVEKSKGKAAPTPLQQLINQAPAGLREDLIAVFPDMLTLAGTVLLNTLSDKPESKEGTQGECLDYLVAPHIEVLQDKHADCIPTVNHFLYQLATHCLFTASNIAGKVIKP